MAVEPKRVNMDLEGEQIDAVRRKAASRACEKNTKKTPEIDFKNARLVFFVTMINHLRSYGESQYLTFTLDYAGNHDDEESEIVEKDRKAKFQTAVMIEKEGKNR